MAGRNPDGKVEVTEYPWFDHLALGVGKSAIQSPTNLFNNASTIGKPAFSNMQQAGTIPSGGVFYISSMRTFQQFLSLADTEYTVAYGSISAVTTPTSSPARMLDCNQHLNHGAQVELWIANKPYLIVPWWALPAGGGLSGQTNVQGRSVVTQGVASKQSVSFFKQPGVMIESLQAFYCKVQFYTFSATAVAGAFTGSAQGGSVADLDPLLFINQADGLKAIGIVLGGIVSRD